MSFALPTFTTLSLRSLNVRAEMHGGDPVPAADIGFRLTTSNKILDQFDPGLRHAFYRAPGGPGPDEPELDGIDAASETPELRTTSVAMPIKLIREYLGRNVVIDYGLGGKRNIELSTCDINEFKADLKEGGTVDLDFRVQVSGLKEEVLGKLAALVRHDIKATILSSAEADGTQEKIPDPGNPFKFSVPDAGGGLVDNNPPAAPDPTGAFIAANKQETPAEKKKAAAAAKKAPSPAAAKKAAAAKKTAKK